MSPTPTPSHRSRPLLLSLAGSIAVCLVLGVAVLGRAPAPSAATPHDHMAMSKEEMQQKIAAWFAVHPETQGSPLAEAADTFFVGDFYMDNNGDGINGPDTAFIQPGDAIMWKWVAGSHTTTNGTDPEDSTAGQIWTATIDISA